MHAMTSLEREELGAARLADAAGAQARLAANIATVVEGKGDQIRLVLAALACQGHVLLEDVPGTAKTVLARSLAGSIEGTTASRIQCTPDLQPTDITGLSVWNPSTRDFEFRAGPVFANVLLVDEINRALPKAQSALLEGMAERQVTVDGVSHLLPSPFFVIATENTIEQEGTFPLPEAQLDRFLVRTSLGYPSLDEELTIVDAQLHGHPLGRLQPVVQLEDLTAVIAAVEDVYIDPLLKRWALELVRVTRSLELVEIGASVRGSLALERMARAWALVQGRPFVVADDVERLFGPVIGHRLILSPEALMSSSEDDDALLDSVLAACLERVPRPEPDWEAGTAPDGP
jgi:MoxR-like ATPase